MDIAEYRIYEKQGGEYVYSFNYQDASSNTPQEVRNALGLVYPEKEFLVIKDTWFYKC